RPASRDRRHRARLWHPRSPGSASARVPLPVSRMGESMTPRILWLATADARGHLMRGQLLARRLAGNGIEVDLVTTSDEGARFLAAFGMRSEVMSRDYRVEFDARHNMARLRTDVRIARYLAAQMRRDLRWLAARAARADLVVNDSNHPALLFAPLFKLTRKLPVVHIYGRNLRRARLENFEGRAPRVFVSTYARVVEALLAKGFARIEHTFTASLDGETDGKGNYWLPPVIAMASRSADEARAELGIAPSDRLAVVYLNPHFRDPEIADAI